MEALLIVRKIYYLCAGKNKLYRLFKILFNLMRRVILLILTTLCCIPFVQAQDIITTKDGKDIQSKILEVNANEVKYKKYNNLDGPTFTLSKSEILIVRYENGENEVFQEHNNSVDKKYNTTAEVVVGMRYREYKNLYNTKEYVP